MPASTQARDAPSRWSRFVPRTLWLVPPLAVVVVAASSEAAGARAALITGLAVAIAGATLLGQSFVGRRAIHVAVIAAVALTLPVALLDASDLGRDPSPPPLPVTAAADVLVVEESLHVARYIGVVAGSAAGTDAAAVDRALDALRQAAFARGASAVVRLDLRFEDGSSGGHVTAVGTAVVLRDG